jgi:pimeloyl-ACP methyl ester carboxylesterase
MADEPWDAAGEIAEVLDAAGIERADVVAASYGGLVALELATLHPDRVGRLVLLSPNLSELEATPDFQRFAEEEERLFEDEDLDAVTELNVRTWLGPEASDEARELVREMQRRAFEIQLAGPEIDPLEVEVDPAAIESETLIVTGDHDLDHFQNIGAHLEATMPDARRVTLPWAGHLPSLERPEEMTALLLEALRPQPRPS